jgi:hypothetical protein
MQVAEAKIQVQQAEQSQSRTRMTSAHSILQLDMTGRTGQSSRASLVV